MNNSIAQWIKELAENIDTFTALKYVLCCGTLKYSSEEKVVVSFEDSSKIQITNVNHYKLIEFEVIHE